MTSTIVVMNGLLSANANCNAIFAESEFFKAFAVMIDDKATKIKSNPYKKQGTNELGFNATNVVKYGINDKMNKANPIDQMTFGLILFTRLNRLLL